MVAPSVGLPVIAASYERVSTRAQGQFGFSLGAQHQSLEDFARVQGWNLPEHLRFRDGEDENASGADWDLPGLTAMLEAARRHEFGVLAVPDFDRFARTLVKGLVLEEQLTKYGVRVVYQRVPVDDSPEGQLLKHQLLSFAEYERQKTALRTRTGKRQKALQGEVVGLGSPPYGYRFTRRALPNGKLRVCGLEPDPITAPVAVRIMREARHRSTIAITDALNTEGVPSPRGGWWLPRTVHRIVADPVYAGVWIYGKQKRRVKPDDAAGTAVPVPALVARAEWDAAQAALADRRAVRRGRGPASEDPYLLRGFLRCGHCHGALQAAPNRGMRTYRCYHHVPSYARRRGKPLCGLPDARAAGLEAELWRVLNATLLDRDFLAAGLAAGVARHEQADKARRDRLAAFDVEIARQRRRLDGYVGDLADLGEGEVRASVLRKAKEIEQLIGRLGTERAALAAGGAEGLSREEATAIEAFAEEVRDGLAAATPADRRALYEALQIRGALFADPEGVCLGRKHRFRVEWTARIPLLNNATAFLKRDAV